MFENFILGCVQGIAEWLPVSSEGLIVLIQTNFLGGNDFDAVVKIALFLHFGTFLAALVYFYKDVGLLLKGLFNLKAQSDETKKTLFFLFITTIISGVLGFGLITFVGHLIGENHSPGKVITLIVGLLLLGTAYLELRAKNPGVRTNRDITLNDCIILGLVQAFAALPGFSRSGLTVSALLLKKFDKAVALKLSFLMSLPIILFGNIILNSEYFPPTLESFVGLLSAFIFGLLTIHLLLKVAEKINFGIFVLIFAIITLLSTLI